jgi:cell division septation protein DedD
MRLSTALALMSVLAVAACGEGPAPEQEPPAPAAPADLPAATPELPAEAADPADPADPTDPARPGESAATGVVPEARAAGSAPLFTVQVAAFTSAESAELWTERLGRADLPVWTSVAELGGQTFYRVRIGAAPTAAEARRLGESLTARYRWPVWVTPLTPADRPPEGVEEHTRRLTGSG